MIRASAFRFDFDRDTDRHDSVVRGLEPLQLAPPGIAAPCRRDGSVPMTAKWMVLLAGLFGFLGVGFGAFGAHALKARLSPELLAVYRTAVEYQFWHTLALLAVGLLALMRPGPLLGASGWCFALGILIFSGSLYALALSGVRVLGAITPLGGLLFLAGWALLAAHAARTL